MTDTNHPVIAPVLSSKDVASKKRVGRNLKRPDCVDEARSGSCAKALSQVEPSRKPAVEKRSVICPLTVRLGYLRAAAGKASPMGAIKAHCLECVSWVREEVTKCTAVACPLFLYRPFQGEVK